MEEREGWRDAMDRWETWKGGGYSTYDATIIECEHGYDVCPECDPCTCGKGVGN